MGVYDTWEYDGWFLYAITNGESYYVGITTDPVNRLRSHSARQRLPGALRFAALHDIGLIWAALDFEGACKKLTDDVAGPLLRDTTAFRKLCATAERKPLHKRAAYATQLYRRYLADGNAPLPHLGVA